ncbi:MAG: ornithine--oxo-acid transaminase [Alphaproteobacteria bacterium 41-28]|nr:MAG: ornithine--oxo-acid transaminase [Alphaproteobacteria bacterium 41-28]
MNTRDYIALEALRCPPTYNPLPIVLCKGKGVWLWDIEGKKYLDMMTAYSAVSFGHAHPRLLKVLNQQAQMLAMTSRAFYTDQLGPFLEKVCELSGFEMGIPMNTGAEAVETAIKVARRWGYEVKGIPENKAEIITANNNFHGRTTTIISFSSEPLYQKDFGPLTPGFKIIPFGDAKALEEAITPNTCAFLVEPIQGEAGIIVPPKGWLKDVHRICKEKNVLLILDEVQSGLGRTGKMFAFQHENIKPDGIILGKALGGGILPISLFLSHREILSLMTPGSHGSTFGGNPLACAVAHEALTILQEDHLAERAAELGTYLMMRLQQIDSPLIKEVRGMGLWIGVDFHKHLVSAREVCEKMSLKGVLSKDTHHTVVRFAPPLIITREEIDFALDVFQSTLKEIEEQKDFL